MMRAMSSSRADPDNDPFKPPAIPTEVHCLHCGQEYESYLIEWREETDADGTVHGFWCCPVEGCGGRGFGFDLLPTDPEYVSEDGSMMWVDDGDEEDEEFDDDWLSESGEWSGNQGPLDSPTPPSDKREGDDLPPIEDDDIPW